MKIFFRKLFKKIVIIKYSTILTEVLIVQLDFGVLVGLAVADQLAGHGDDLKLGVVWSAGNVACQNFNSSMSG